MLKRCLAGLALATALVWTASAEDARTVIANASKTMGVDTLKTVQLTDGLGLRPRSGAESELAVAEVHREELHARHQLRSARLHGRPRAHAGREPAARRRAAAGRR